jgi:glycosyltransferase involved in cell wall biosynthesis
MVKVGVLICAYNEEKHIARVINGCLNYVKDIIVVNDGSTDDTLEEARKTKARIISYKKNRGKGAALKKGFEYGWKNKYDYFILLDGDGQHDPNEIPKFTRAIERGNDLVIGARRKRHSSMPYLRRFTNFMSSLFLSVRRKTRIKDSQSGYRAINLNFLKKISLVKEKYDLESEVLIKMIKKGARVRNVPIRTIYRDEKSTIHPAKDTWRFFKTLFMRG